VIRRIALLATLATLALAPSASAQGATIQAVDNPSVWSPAQATVKTGETVTWSFAGTSLPHNVKSTSDNWSIDSPASTTDPSPVSYTFSAPGTYTFVCIFHPSTMTGSVTVTDAGGNPPPPPPPPPPGETAWPNDQQPPSEFETGPVSDDRTPPRVSRVRAQRVRNGARVRFRLSERARVLVTFKLGGLTVKTARQTFGPGRRSLTVRDRRMDGRYKVEVVARDRAGNRSRVKRDWVTIR
jgi:plastocyanin